MSDMEPAIDLAALPSWPDEHLAGLSPEALVDLLVASDDRVPRNLVDACARRGSDMVRVLRERLDFPGSEFESDGEWWLRMHAVMILGLVPEESAALLLVDWMRRMSAAEEVALQNWLAAKWPAFFVNKPASVLPAVRDLACDRAFDWYMRAMAQDVVVAAAEREGPAALQASLDWVAGMAGDEAEDWEMRLTAGRLLLDFPREPYRPLLEDLAKRQGVFDVRFGADDIGQAYAEEKDSPEWRHFENPWAFYDPETIMARQQRWAEEDETRRLSGDHDDWPGEAIILPYVRELPKIGRNDPCPCGSGRKYKKCCLGKDDAPPAIFE